MIQVNDIYIDADMKDILQKLKIQLYENGIDVFHKIIFSGNNIQTTCPFHKSGKERKPSFGIMLKDRGNYKVGQCHCFACGWSGSLQEMISNCLGYDDMGVFGGKWLIQNFLTMSIETRTEIDLNLDRKVKEEVKYISDDEYDKFRYYHPYMYKRKMNDLVIDIFDIGYDKDTDCITFNCRNKQGNTLFVARRSVNTKYFNYPENVEKQVYGIYELYSLDKFPSEVYICESMLDALVFWTHENKYACALNGLGNDLQFKQLREMPCRKFILATDMDEAGLKARKKLRKELPNKLITEVFFPHNKKDANECTFDEVENLVEVF